MGLSLEDPQAFRAAVARETAHAAVAEHFGMRVERLALDWRGFPVCHYGGTVEADLRAHEVNLIVLLAGLVGARLFSQVEWRTSASDLRSWTDELEFDPNDTPDSGYQSDLVLALQAAGGDVARLQALEASAHALLTGDAQVRQRWEGLSAELLALAR